MYLGITLLIHASVCAEHFFPSLDGFISGKQGFEC